MPKLEEKLNSMQTRGSAILPLLLFAKLQREREDWSERTGRGLRQRHWGHAQIRAQLLRLSEIRMMNFLKRNWHIDMDQAADTAF